MRTALYGTTSARQHVLHTFQKRHVRTQAARTPVRTPLRDSETLLLVSQDFVPAHSFPVDVNTRVTLKATTSQVAQSDVKMISRTVLLVILIYVKLTFTFDTPSAEQHAAEYIP